MAETLNDGRLHDPKRTIGSWHTSMVIFGGGTVVTPADDPRVVGSNTISTSYPEEDSLLPGLGKVATPWGEGEFQIYTATEGQRECFNSRGV